MRGHPSDRGRRMRRAIKRPVLLLRRTGRTFRALSRGLGVRRSAALVLRTTLRSARPVSFTWPGLAHEVWVRPGTSDIRSFVEVICERVYEWPDGFLPSAEHPDPIIDVGANVGFSALWFNARFPGARIIALEPDRENFEMLRRNTDRVPGIECRNLALWNEGTRLDLDPGYSADSRRVRATGAAGGAGSEMVDAIDMATLLGEIGTDRVGLLKIDVEGAEWEVFADSAGWIDRVDMIAGELHERFRPGVAAVVDDALVSFPRRTDRRYEFFVSR